MARGITMLAEAPMAVAARNTDSQNRLGDSAQAAEPSV